MKLYRVENQSQDRQCPGSGRWFTDSAQDLYWYKQQCGPYATIKTLDLPDDVAEKFRMTNLPLGHEAQQYSFQPDREFFITDDSVLAQARIEPALPLRCSGGYAVWAT